MKEEAKKAKSNKSGKKILGHPYSPFLSFLLIFALFASFHTAPFAINLAILTDFTAEYTIEKKTHGSFFRLFEKTGDMFFPHSPVACEDATGRLRYNAW
ncbi:MAG: hypothetical protein J2P41_10040, partial [Blastocatellia bacterium]|nr:hypothetical protein [Blastocatellia bacterium]